jgi:carbon-monoxide dehydrogenase large subunit
MPKLIGEPVPRREDDRLLRGLGQFTDDIRPDGAAACVFVRSPHAHARIDSIDATAARQMPGVLAVLTAREYIADGLAGIAHLPNPADALDVSKRAFAATADARVADIRHWPLARERVRHVGEPVAAVIATAAPLARDAMERVAVAYEALPAVVDPLQALAPQTVALYDDVPGNLCFDQWFGDREETRRALDGAAHVVSARFVQNRVVIAQMEPRAAIGTFDGASDTYTLIAGSQGSHRLQSALASALQCAPSKVRVVSPDVGGGFGPRTLLYPEHVIVAWTAKRLGHPVKWTSDRSEAFVSDYQGRDGVIHASLGLDAAGRIVGYAVELVGNVGAHTVSYVPMANAQRILTSLYDVPHASVRVRGVLTNSVPTSPYRGAGRPEALHAIERLLDIAARRLGIDRIELRKRNLIRREQLPYRSAMGLCYDCGDFAGNFARVLDAADWRGFAARREAARARGRLAGIGVANYVEAPVGAPIERAQIVVHGDGEVAVLVGTQSSGQGHETSFAQVVAERLGVPLEAVHVRYGDTALVGAGGGSHSDRSMRIAGTILLQASDDIVEQARDAAAALLEAAVPDIAFDGGVFRVAGTDRRIALTEVARAIVSDPRVPLEERKALAPLRKFNGRIAAHPTGAAVCEVEIDPESGAISIVRYTTVDDVGQPINPLIVDGQVHGGIAQGVGQALLEHVAVDAASGQILAGSFMDYGIPRADELPSFHVELVEDPTTGNPLRVKGAGEAGITPATAAVVGAICDALGHDGPEDLPMPLTSASVWRALRRNARI